MRKGSKKTKKSRGPVAPVVVPSSNSARGLLLRIPMGASNQLGLNATTRVKDAEFELSPLFSVGGAELGVSGGSGHDWVLARPRDTMDPQQLWQSAYELMSRSALPGIAGSELRPTFIEPDLEQPWPVAPGAREASRSGRTSALGLDDAFRDQKDENGHVPTVPGRFAWHLDDEYSQLRAARARATPTTGAPPIRIAHLDTGYDPQHAAFDANRFEAGLQRNYIDGEDFLRDARDRDISGILKQPGHGTATLALLTGGRITFQKPSYKKFDEALGGAPHVRFVPLRVGNSVVQVKTSSVAQAISYAAELCNDPATRIDVISMSMGGVASAAWADAVNKAYEAGIVFVAAAGNNFGGLPARHIVFPARFERVIAACGVMADKRPYTGLPINTMQGCWGPSSKMETAMAAFTPNLPWARIGTRDIIDMDGSGTSSATPQIAAAAALYLQTHQQELFDPEQYPQAWMRVEAVRHALFGSAHATDETEKLGHGILKAHDALTVSPAKASMLRKSREAHAWFAFLRVLTGLGVSASAVDNMLQLEATQLLQMWDHEGVGPNPLEAAITDPDAPLTDIPNDQVQAFLAAIHDHPRASKQLRQRVDQVLSLRRNRISVRSLPPTHTPARTRTSTQSGSSEPRHTQPFSPPTPAHRLLRGFTLDPSLSQSLETMAISQMTMRVPWESVAPGPVGEYLEVVDIDPASGCAYEPVNLDDPRILAQNGLAPSEGTPQFHQQMVYATAMMTIANFERALGRKSLWRPGPSLDSENRLSDKHFVQRLRVYPHALREANAYYSPERVAMLFGYFNAVDDSSGEHMPGSRVFTCLSHDIIAHETTHALLDGMHRQFLRASNPDVRAFHEAFADIVALFQHFTITEVLSHEVARTRGDIRNRESLFGNLALQFGRGRGLGKALRRAIGEQDERTGEWRRHVPDPKAMETATGPYERGSILVGAVFDAFLAIYDRRVADLLRLATGGSGILSPGEIHPDLVNRLASEASRAAQHVLTMCIRALDYCPPTDITFGEYLRAILTADADVEREDSMQYRVAFAEAFRRRGIFPLGLRTLSPESLMWRTPAQDDPPRPDVLSHFLRRLGGYARAELYARDRRETFTIQYRMRATLHKWLSAHFTESEQGRADAAFLGIELPANAQTKLRFEVHTARIAHRAGPDGTVEPRLMLGLLQRRHVQTPEGGAPILFEGGCTIVAELRTPRVLYCIRKRSGSENRLKRQVAFMASVEDASCDEGYAQGSSRGTDDGEPFALMHRGCS